MLANKTASFTVTSSFFLPDMTVLNSIFLKKIFQIKSLYHFNFLFFSCKASIIFISFLMSSFLIPFTRFHRTPSPVKIIFFPTVPFSNRFPIHMRWFPTVKESLRLSFHYFLTEIDFHIDPGWGDLSTFRAFPLHLFPPLLNNEIGSCGDIIIWNDCNTST